MSVLLTQPTTVNFLSTQNATFEIEDMPNFTPTIQKINVPGLTLPSAMIGTPFGTLNEPGDRVDYGPIDITYKVDEGLYNWCEFYDWITGLAENKSFDSYRSMLRTRGSPTCDASLTILGGTRQPMIKLIYSDVSPVSMSGFLMDRTVEGVDYVSSTVQFKFTNYSYQRMTT